MPYMALQQHHLLSDISVRGFVAGATNILFRQQRHLSDAIVDVSTCAFLSLIHNHSNIKRLIYGILLGESHKAYKECVQLIFKYVDVFFFVM